MLKTILNRLNGHAVEAPSLAEALAQLGRDREAEKAHIDSLNGKRRQALLDDASDAELDKLERQIDRATVRLEKIAMAEQPLRERLAEATAAERRKRWESHFADFRERAGAFLTAARATAAAHDALLAVRARATAEGFSRELASLPFTPSVGPAPVCSADLLDRFEAALAGRAPATLAPCPAPVEHYQGELSRFDTSPPAAPTRRPPPRERTGHAVAVDTFTGREIGASVPARAPQAQDDEAPLQPGEARVIVLRSGYSANGSVLSHAGHKVRLPADTAMAAARAGAVEIVERSAP